jgi:hypothetical protein
MYHRLGSLGGSAILVLAMGATTGSARAQEPPKKAEKATSEAAPSAESKPEAPASDPGTGQAPPSEPAPTGEPGTNDAQVSPEAEPESDEVIAEESEEVVAEEAAESQEGAEPGSDAAPLPGQDPKRPVVRGNGVLLGRVLDGTTGEPLVDAELLVVGKGVSARSDQNGNYRLEIAPGRYKVQVQSDLYDGALLEGVVLRPNKSLEVTVNLLPQLGAIEEVVLEEAASTESVEGLAIARQKSLGAGDAIGREQISKGTDSNAAQAAQRVVGANIVGGRFVYVRGLGERYSNSLLSGYPLPSPEPDRAAVPLDVFPAAVLDSINIQKTFTPDMPGDFAGGSVQIETRSVPRDPFFNASISGGINTQSTFQSRLGYPGGGTDFLGLDDGTRSMPNSVPRDRTFNSQTDNVEQISRDINSPFGQERTDTPVDHGFTVVGGNTFKLGGKQELGFLASTNYSRKFFKIDDEIINEYTPDPSQPLGYRKRLGYTVERGIDQVRWGAFGKITYFPSPAHNITLSGLHSQLSDNASNHFSGLAPDGQINALQNDWVQRGLSFGLLSGRHQIASLNGAEVNWDASLARASRQQPDRRDNVYSPIQFPPPPVWQVRGENDASRHFWSEQVETSGGGKLDYKQPLLSGVVPLAMKLGGLVNLKQRDFSARRLYYQTNMGDFRRTYGRCPGGETFTIDCPDSVFVDQAITDGLRAADGYLEGRGDVYTSHLNIFAGYAMLDAEFAKQLRLAGGGRLEATDQGIIPLKLDDTTDTHVPSAQLSSVDFLPAVSAVLGGTNKMKTRASYGRTLARPQVRELAPFEFSDYFSGRSTVGNPDLKLSHIDNIDFRVEYFPTLAEVLALSVFYKYIASPIEPYLIPADANPQVTFKNADHASLIGAEFEVRKGLGFLTTVLQDFSVNTNLSLTYSRTEVEQTGQNTITHPSRALVNQAPWVLNVALDYENRFGTTARVAYNVSGPALVLIGQDGLDDGFLQSFHRIDLALSQRFLESFKGTLTVSNLANDDFLTTMGKDVRADNILNQSRQGTQIQLSLAYEFTGGRKRSEAPNIQ